MRGDRRAGRAAGLFAVPAEEYVEIEYRLDLRRQGKLEFLGGKAELIKLGELDDVDMAMMVHVTSRPQDRKVGLTSTNNGMVAKFVKFLGKAAHAGGAPDQGINALNAIVDYETAAIVPAKCMAMTLIDLLADGAAGARRILAEHQPAMTKDAYLSLLRGLAAEQTV